MNLNHNFLYPDRFGDLTKKTVANDVRVQFGGSGKYRTVGQQTQKADSAEPGVDRGDS